MFSQVEKELSVYCIKEMFAKEDLMELFYSRGISCRKSATYAQFGKLYQDAPKRPDLNEIRSFLREKWKQRHSIEQHLTHIRQLRSGVLQGHDWCGASPLHLHMHFQNKVRDYISGIITWEQYCEMGLAILKHEYYMVAVHDICEATIIRELPDTIPPTRSKCVTDFVFKGVPVDLKVTNFLPDWQIKSGHLTTEDKIQLAAKLYNEADQARARKQGEGKNYNWGLSRLYVLTADTENWLRTPEQLLTRLLEQLRVAEPFSVVVDGVETTMFLVDI